jgi:alpha-L-fucosidase
MKPVGQRSAAPRAGWALIVLLVGTLGVFSPTASGAGEDDPAAAPAAEPVAEGPFKPEWDSLKQYQCPDWFRDAKFGIWAHWSAQCVPEQGDWYARNLYQQYRRGRDGKDVPNPVYTCHVEHYGHPSKVGFKDIDHLWHAEHWDPEKLMALYKRAGARYFVALANHHDNFDCYDSKYQPWNSVKIGPKKDLVGQWKKAAQDAGLRFGVTVHAARAWSWFEVAQGADKDGPLAGVAYDGRLRMADGKGTGWEGLDPQDLYAQHHTPKQMPDAAYCTKFYNRIIDLINKYQPDLLYFDDDYTNTGLPLYDTDPTVGLRIAAHYYNVNGRQHGGKLEAVLNAKRVSPDKRGCVVLDIERGGARDLQEQPWQTDTCIGNWHYDRALAERHGYKKPGDVLRTLADIVSKNGNLLLSIPVRGDGTIDEDEVKFLEETAAWMSVNGEAIFGTRPWAVCGEGPSTTVQGRAGGPFNEGRTRYTAEDVRFTTRDNVLYAIGLVWPDNGGKLTIKSLASDSPGVKGKIGTVHLLGQDAALAVTRDASGLTVTLPAPKPESATAPLVLKIALAGAQEKPPPAAADTAPPKSGPSDVLPLRETFKGKFLIGTALDSRGFRNQLALEIATTHFNAITPENGMKPMFLQPTEGDFTFADADSLVELAEKSGATPIGHCLVWHAQTPRWFFQGPDEKPAGRELALDRLRKHIATVVGHYKGRVKQWDVVNEAISDAPDDWLRPSPWLKAIGEDYIAEAFRAAHEADPDATLVYNDYGIEKKDKRAKALKLLKSLIENKVPVHAVGIQAHWRMDTLGLAEVEESIKQFADLGLKVMITELDISVLPARYQGADISKTEPKETEKAEGMNPYTQGLPDDVAKGHAELYGQAFAMFLRHQDVIGRVTFWGVYDGRSWLNNFPVRGRTDYPLLFDRQGKPKAAFFAVTKAAQDAPAAPPMRK